MRNKSLVLGIGVLIVLTVIWAIIPNHMFDVNIHSTFYVFGMNTIVAIYALLLILTGVSFWLKNKFKKIKK